MAKVRELGGSLAAPKARSFGSVLRDAFRAEFGTARAFAARLGVTEGRISQIVRGPEAVAPETLEGILAVIETPALRESVHAAWVAEFAPLTPSGTAPEDWTAVLAELDGFMGLGMPVRAREFARKVRSETRDPFLRHMASVQVAQIDLRLGRVAAALGEIDRIEQSARDANEPGCVVAAYWMRSVALRSVEPMPLAFIEAAHGVASSVASDWNPRNTEAKELRREFHALLSREYALAVVAVAEGKRLEPAALEAASRAVVRSMDLGRDEKFICTGLEVRARIEVALGRLVKAEDTLDEIQSRGLGNGPDLEEKVTMTRSRIHLLRNEQDAAAHLLREAADRSLDRMNLHHHRRAERLLARLAARI